MLHLGRPDGLSRAGGFALGFWGRTVTTMLLYPFFHVQTKVRLQLRLHLQLLLVHMNYPMVAYSSLLGSPSRLQLPTGADRQHGGGRGMGYAREDRAGEGCGWALPWSRARAGAWRAVSVCRDGDEGHASRGQRPATYGFDLACFPKKVRERKNTSSQDSTPNRRWHRVLLLVIPSAAAIAVATAAGVH